jgi:hypothetical protein
MSDMFELKRGGVHRIVATEGEAKKLISEGYIQLDEEGNPITSESGTIEELKAQIEQLTAENAALKAAAKK